jgi:hypothetical protein
LSLGINQVFGFIIRDEANNCTAEDVTVIGSVHPTESVSHHAQKKKKKFVGSCSQGQDFWFKAATLNLERRR